MGTYMSMPTASHLHILCKAKKNESKKGLCVLINNAIWWQNSSHVLSNMRGVSGDSDVKLQGTLHSTANDTQTENDPQNGPQMILVRKWSLLSTANDPVKSGGMDFKYGCTLGARGFSCAVSGSV